MNALLWIWSHFPFFCLSDDDNFANLNWRKIKEGKSHLRFSLINIMFGDSILYFTTVDIKRKKFSLFYILYLKNMEGILLTEEKIADIEEKYKQHISTLNDQEMEAEKEKLAYHIQNEEQRISRSMDKINIYATIILTVLPLILAILDLKAVINLPFTLIAGVAFIVYALLNICTYIFRAIKVTAISKSSFSDLKKSSRKDKELLVQYYYDWQQLKYKAQLFVSFVLNLQEWMILILVLSVGVSSSIAFKDNISNKYMYNRTESEVLSMNLDEIEMPHSESSILWHRLLLQIDQNNCNRIIIISNQDKELSIVYDELRKYDDLELVKMKDSTLDGNQIKVIQEE